MKNSAHVFNPEMAEIFLQSGYLDKIDGNDSDHYLGSGKFINRSESKSKQIIDSRYLFYQLNQTGSFQNIFPTAYDFIIKSLMVSERVYSASIFQHYSEEQLLLLKPPQILPLPDLLLTQKNLNRCINQSAPILLTQTCWLQNISQVSFCQTMPAVQLMSIYLQLTQKKQGDFDLLEAYRSLILSTGVRLPILHSYWYSQKAGILSEVFDFAAIQLCLARFPRLFLPEILGYTLAYCRTPSLIEICFPNYQLHSSFFKLCRERVEEQEQPLLVCIKGYLDFFIKHKQVLWQRIQNGFWLYELQMSCCRDRFKTYLENPLSSQQAITRLFQQKAKTAIGHHQNIQLGGKNLDSWFAGMPANSQEFILALKKSSYVNQQTPEESSLLKLFEFKGSMFGVMNESEQVILKSWLKNGLKEAPTNSIEDPVLLPVARNYSVKDYAHLNNRELYYYLLNADMFPDVLPIGKDKADKLLRYCTFFNPPPFKHYTHALFDTYIENIYNREMSTYHPMKGKPKISREAYVWGIEQIAPMILIDGCWLQNSLTLQNINQEISEILFSIYCDEIGNGRLEENHPYIFQQLLDSLLIQLPPVHSKDFIKHQGFINKAFDLPVFMLSLSSFSVEFLPELLGLNMAIELSGLGKSYLNLIDEWNYWGIDPTIAKIHVSIDNYDSGHTFLAKKAIQLYLDDVNKCSGDQAILNKQWRRVYNGYASLRFAGWHFKLGLPFCYLIHKFTGQKNAV